MKLNELLLSYINKEKTPRIPGRYWATDIYSIIKGYLIPENFLKPSEADLTGCKMMITGEAFEEKLKMIFDQAGIDYEYQVKREYQLKNDIVLVARPDFVFPKFILETKFPFSLVKNNEIPPRYQSQLEVYYRIFNYKKVYLGLLSIPFNLKLIPYVPSKWRWQQICKTLEEFNLKVEALINQNKLKM